MITPMRPLSRRARIPSQRGSAAVELTILVPALVLVLGLLVAGGRLWFARSTVADAASAAARTASLARSAGDAVRQGRVAGERSLGTRGLRCASSSVQVDAGSFAVPVGTPATVRTQVTCRVPLSDIGLPGLPGSIELSAAGASALDTYRERS